MILNPLACNSHRSGSKMGSALSRHGRSGFHDDMEEMYEYLEYSGLPGNLDLQEDGLRDSTLAQPLMPPYQGESRFHPPASAAI